ncbi:hypothetical protein [Deinococcus malanensis]|uniref:hypothetical protein n=1 Tax=Deinococcus malanensis TaxID=1706855 RepID=UPI001E334124|nr:hypothetical protein [Deinococcus malanensis]
MKPPIPASVLTLLTLLLSAGQVAAAQETLTPPTAVPATVAPHKELRSQVSLTLSMPAGAQSLLVVQALPPGTSYQGGSSRWNGRPLPEPASTPRGLVWQVPVERAPSGVLTFTLSHAGALPALGTPAVAAGYASGLLLPVSGTPDLAQLGSLSVAVPAENASSIRLPLDGSDVQVRDAVNVTVTDAGPEAQALMVNGAPVPATLVGEEATLTGGGTLRTYIGVPLRPGANLLQHGTDQITVYRVGPTEALELSPLALIADGRTPLRVQVRAVDASGRTTNLSTVTVASDRTPTSPDAVPGQTGHQLRLEGGLGVLEFAPQSRAGEVILTVSQGELLRTATFPVTTERTTVGVGVLSATLGLDGSLSADDLSWQARASLETEVGGGHLKVTADKDGLPTDLDTLKRFTIAGDASVTSVPLQGSDPVAFRYEHPAFGVQYRHGPLPVDVLPFGAQITALSASTRSNPQVSGFVALVPTDLITGERVTPDGTRLLRLARGQISPGSETLTWVTLDRVTGEERSRTVLVRNADYQLDLNSGLVTLTRPLSRYDLDLGEQYVEASYRLSQPLGQRDLAFGVQTKYQTSHVLLGAAVVHLDNQTTVGARAAYDDGQLHVDALLASSDGLLAQGSFGARFGQTAASASVRYQDIAYAGLGKGTPGLSAAASVTTELTERLDAQVTAQYRHETSKAGTVVTHQGQADGQLVYQLDPFQVGAGLRYSFGDQQGLSAVGRVGYRREPLSVDLSHAQPLSGNVAPESSLGVRYRLSGETTFGVTSRYTWGVGGATVLSVDSRVNGVDYTAAYELPTASGGGNLARFGVSTTLPLNDTTSLGLYGSAQTNATTRTHQAAAGANLRYKTERLSATLGTDVVYNPAGFGVVVRGGAAGSVSNDLTLSADGLAEFGAGKAGLRLAAGYAYRSRNIDSLGTVRYVDGTLAGGQPELSSSLAAIYHQPRFAVRAGMDSRTLLNDAGSFTVQGSLSGTYYVTDRVGLGAWGHILSHPSTGTTVTGFGLEGSYRVLPGTWLTAGYNPVGFTGISNTYTKQGLYLRLDLTLDDSLGGNK